MKVIYWHSILLQINDLNFSNTSPVSHLPIALKPPNPLPVTDSHSHSPYVARPRCLDKKNLMR
jgi:hypothetical protein